MPESFFRELVRTVGAEPVLILSQFASYLQFPVFQALTIHKVCLAKYDSTTICDHLRDKAYKAEKDAVHEDASIWLTYNNILVSLPAVLVALMLGAWSDRKRGRQRYAILVPLIAALLSNVILVVISLKKESPVGTVLISSALLGVGGSQAALLMASFSLLALVVSEHRRSVRVGVMEASSYMGAMLGLATNGLLLDGVGFTATFGAATGVSGLALIYAAARLPFLHVPGSAIPTSEGSGQEAASVCHTLGLEVWRDAVVSITKVRPNKRRALILILLAAFCLYIIINSAQIDLTLLLLRNTLSWTQTRIGIYEGALLALKVFGLVCLVPLSKHFMKLHDSTLVLGALAPYAGVFLLLGLSRHTWVVYLTLLLAWAAGMVPAGMRALLASYVGPEEQGRVFAALGALEGLGFLIGGVSWNPFYSSVVHVLPGIPFIVAAALVMVVLLPLVVALRLIMSREGLLAPPVAYVNIDNPLVDELTSADALDEELPQHSSLAST